MQDQGQGCGSSSLPVECLSVMDMVLQGPTSHIDTPPCAHSLRHFGKNPQSAPRTNCS